VDPTIGTTTVGSQYLYEPDPGEGWVPLRFECDIPVNRFLVNETINGNCTAYFYANDDEWGDAGGYPVIYTDKVIQNKGNMPEFRKSTQEKFIDLNISGGVPKGWRSGTFSSNGSISAGSYIWFGCFTLYFWYPRFDYGETFFNWFWDDEDVIPDPYPGYWWQLPDAFKLSMYFDYTSAQNYVRKLTQGVTLTDKHKLTANYKRSSAQTVNGTAFINPFRSLFRSIPEALGITDTVRYWGEYFRGLYDEANNTTEAITKGNYYRKESDIVQAKGAVFRGLLLFVKIATTAFVRDYILRRFLVAREEIVLKSCVCREISLDSKII
jgi:hypothetical protein